MFDLDIMVKKEYLERASEVLREMGYYARREFWTDFETASSHQLPVFFHPMHFPVELHWTIISPKLPYQIDQDGLWQRARNVKLDAQEALVLSREDFILHLSIHAATQHKLTGGLRLIYDIAVALNRYQNEFDWPLLASLSQSWHATAPLFLSITLSQNLFGSGAPDGFLDSIQPEGYDASWLNSAMDLLLINPNEHPDFSRYLATVLKTNPLGDKSRLILQRVFPPPRKIVENFPVKPGSPRLWLYYPLYLILLVRKHLRVILKIAEGDGSTIDAVNFTNLIQERENYLEERLLG